MRSCRPFMLAVFLALFSLLSFNSSFAAETAGAITEARKIYRCYPGYDPVYCELVYQDSSAADVGTTALANALAKTSSNRAAAGGPITQCGNSKGHSACCKIVGYLEDGSVIIECGVNSAPQPVATESIYECRRDNDGKTRCSCIRACPITPTDDGGEAKRVEVTVQNLEKFDLAEVLAVSRALKTGVPTPILDALSTGPITQCGNGHGQTACCKIISGDPGDPLVYIECGRNAVPTTPVVNKPPTGCIREPGDRRPCPPPL